MLGSVRPLCGGSHILELKSRGPMRREDRFRDDGGSGASAPLRMVPASFRHLLQL